MDKFICFFFQGEDGIRDDLVTGVQTCALRSIKDAMEQAMLTDEPPPPRIVPMPALSKRLDREEMRKAASPEAALIIVANALRPIPGPKSIILFGWGLGRLTPGGVMNESKYMPGGQALAAGR